MIHDPVASLPSVEEILSGETQGGVPRPAVLDRDDRPIGRTAVQDAEGKLDVACERVEVAQAALLAAARELTLADAAMRAASAAYTAALTTEQAS